MVIVVVWVNVGGADAGFLQPLLGKEKRLTQIKKFLTLFCTPMITFQSEMTPMSLK